VTIAQSTSLFTFVQLEFTHSIGPPPGRYTIHPHDHQGSYDRNASLGSADVLVVQVRGAPGPARRRFRPSLPAAPPGAAPAEISVTVVTVVLATSMLDNPESAKQLLASLKGSSEQQQQLVAGALAIVNRGVSAYRLAAADPYVPDLSPLDARAVRIGYGDASSVVRGGWSEAFGVKPAPVPKLARTTRLMPIQAMAGMLAGTIGVLEAEEPILCVVRDLDQGRNRAAAITLPGAQELLLAELAGHDLRPQVVELVAKVESGLQAARRLAGRALLDQLSSRDQERLRELAEDAGALVDAWRYVPLGFG
jgi:hypothetical protein